MNTAARREAPVGVFDSGVGGLSVLASLRAALPHERFVYLADSAHAPYGERGDAFVLERAEAVTRELLARHDIKALVVACNTATAAAIARLRESHPRLAIVGVEPALKPAAALTLTGRVGVMATRGTLESAKFKALLAGLSLDANYHLQACDGLADAIEHDRPAEVLALCRKYLKALGRFGTEPGDMDTLVLGCTHYPFAADTLLSLLPDEVNLVHTGPAVARQCARLLRDMRLAREEGTGSLTLEATGDDTLLRQAAARWL